MENENRPSFGSEGSGSVDGHMDQTPTPKSTLEFQKIREQEITESWSDDTQSMDTAPTLRSMGSAPTLGSLAEADQEATQVGTGGGLVPAAHNVSSVTVASDQLEVPPVLWTIVRSFASSVTKEHGFGGPDDDELFRKLGKMAVQHMHQLLVEHGPAHKVTPPPGDDEAGPSGSGAPDEAA